MLCFAWRNCDRLTKYHGDTIGGEQNAPNRKGITRMTRLPRTTQLSALYEEVNK